MANLPASITQAQTLPQLLALRVSETPKGEAYRSFDESRQQWSSLSWKQTEERVLQWCKALAAQQLPAGARVAILLPNGLDAMTMDQASLRCALVPVPLHAIDNAGSVAYILADSGASLLLVADAKAWQKICATGQSLPELKAVILAPQGKAAEEGYDARWLVDENALPEIQALQQIPLLPLSQWLAKGREQNRPLPAPPVEEDLAGIVYTSGTTGKPKGVMLTHRNVVSDLHAVMQRVQAFPSDVFLSFLPLSHTFERTTGYYLAVACGSCVAYARSVAQIAEDMKTVKPTVLISVPRIYERVNAKIVETLAKSPFKHQLFNAAVAVGWKRFFQAQGIKPEAGAAKADTDSGGWMQHLPWWLLQILVAKPLLAQFGGRLRAAVSGGAPLSAANARVFLGLGLPLIQGYGMTETAPVVAANALDDNHPATVGRALPTAELRIGEDRELQIRGPMVMRGYWNRPEDTAKTFTADGWLKTGDQAVMEDGRVRIQGRIKEIIVTSTGEKIPPNDVEQAIMADPLFEQVLILGEDRPFIACIAVVNTTEWQAMAQGLGLDASDPASLNHSAAEREALARIEKQTRSFARYAVPRAVHLVQEPWTIDNSLMTPTLKLKRKNLMAYYEQDIETMYGKPVDRWKNSVVV
ncbi:MAG: long-chain fatty acid--CoA ligase [Comamonas sp.]